ncbi:MAG: hypothetical protein CM1200mP18_02690 [Gammaproteobacteria bacterium]|nr:MAG: hypothetical protein CM1200mP18_02690 [Gammaproteobacteria bacterium]
MSRGYSEPNLSRRIWLLRRHGNAADPHRPYVMDLGHPAIRGAEMLGLMLVLGDQSHVSGWLSDRIGGLATLLIGSTLQLAV